MKIMAFDPGVTTGIAIYDSKSPDEFTTGEATSAFQPENLFLIWNELDQQEPDRVVYEKFTPPAATRHRVELFPVQVIGVIRLYAHLNVVDEYSHTASMAKGFWTDEKIKRLDLWVPSQGHGMDALRHLLYHITVTMNDRTWVEKIRLDPKEPRTGLEEPPNSEDVGNHHWPDVTNIYESHDHEFPEHHSHYGPFGDKLHGSDLRATHNSAQVHEETAMYHAPRGEPGCFGRP